MPNGIYCIGGRSSPCTSDFLPNGQCEWQAGPVVPEPGIGGGHGVAISDTELLIIGCGYEAKNKMLKFNIEKKLWTDVGSLLQGRWFHRSFLYKGKVIVTGGKHVSNPLLKLTEVIDLSSWASKRAGELNVQRWGHGMGLVEINGKSKLIVFGGGYNGSIIDSIEEWDEDSETWKMSTMKMSSAKQLFGYLQLPQF